MFAIRNNFSSDASTHSSTGFRSTRLRAPSLVPNSRVASHAAAATAVQQTLVVDAARQGAQTQGDKDASTNVRRRETIFGPDVGEDDEPGWTRPDEGTKVSVDVVKGWVEKAKNEEVRQDRVHDRVDGIVHACVHAMHRRPNSGVRSILSDIDRVYTLQPPYKLWSTSSDLPSYSNSSHLMPRTTLPQQTPDQDPISLPPPCTCSNSTTTPLLPMSTFRSRSTHPPSLLSRAKSRSPKRKSRRSTVVFTLVVSIRYSNYLPVPHSIFHPPSLPCPTRVPSRLAMPKTFGTDHSIPMPVASHSP